MKILCYWRSKKPLFLMAGLCRLLTVVNLGFAEPWTPTSAPAGPWKTVASSADGIKLVATGGDNFHDAYGTEPPFSIYASVDSGATWTQTSAPKNYWSSIASSADGTKLVAAIGGQIYYGSDDPYGSIYTLQFPLLPPPSPPSPLLNVERVGGTPVVSWRVPSTSFVLQENSDLTTTNWTDVATPPTLNFTNLHYEVAVSTSLTNRFYRLKQQ